MRETIFIGQIPDTLPEIDQWQLRRLRGIMQKDGAKFEEVRQIIWDKYKLRSLDREIKAASSLGKQEFTLWLDGYSHKFFVPYARYLSEYLHSVFDD